jgi:hypothetical protein
MLDFKFLDADPYEDRLVARTEGAWGYISTASINDSPLPFETAISHELYKEGRLIIVEEYSSRGAAALGHAVWVALMETNPVALTDVSSTEDAILYRELGGQTTWLRKDLTAEEVNDIADAIELQSIINEGATSILKGSTRQASEGELMIIGSNTPLEIGEIMDFCTVEGIETVKINRAATPEEIKSCVKLIPEDEPAYFYQVTKLNRQLGGKN